MVAGLLFLAFAYFAVGQASMKKNEAQTAADAAALAAALDTRDGLRWPGTFDLDAWTDLLDGQGVEEADSCGQADALAARNGATGISCERGYQPYVSYTVTVETDTTVGDSVIEGTNTKRAKATARAVIEPLCRIEEGPAPTPTPTPTAGDGGGGGPDDGDDEDGKDGEDDHMYKITCDRGSFDVDPKHLADLPVLADLFSVHLADE
ncbi:pilus assembly protein TadG-related protein [Streptomyces sp. DT171]|uniref:pilus assembly protein TadG-related protein n=1 Tax=Streptomyces sp. DT171 TaxID=3416524 RepID=UPI003CF273A7